jgi:ankyrin repeat protein
MRFVKNMLVLSLVGLSLVSFSGGTVTSKALVPVTQAARRSAQQTAGLGWRAAQVTAGAAGAAGTAYVLTGGLSEKPDMPQAGHDYEQAGTEGMGGPSDLGQDISGLPGDMGNGLDIPMGMQHRGSGGSAGAAATMSSERDARQKNPIDILVEQIKHGNSVAVQELIELGVPVNQKDRHGALPLTVATVLGFYDIVSKLLEAGARVDLMDRNVIESADWGLKNILQFARGAQAEMRAVINDQDEFGQTPLMRAVTQGDQNKTRKYLAWGASIDLADSNGNTPLLRALILGNLEAVDILIAAGADIARSNKAGDTPRQIIFNLLFEAAVKAGNVQAVAELVKEAEAEGLDLNRFGLGNTPLIVAIEQGDAAMVKILLDAGADANKDINGLTPIRVAVEANKVEAAKLLLAAGVDANGTVGNGVFLLMVASAMGSKDMVWALLAAGANSAVQVQGKSAEDVARQFGHMDVVNLLEEVDIERHRGGRQAQDKALEEARRLEHKALIEMLEKAQQEQEGEQSK